MIFLCLNLIVLIFEHPLCLTFELEPSALVSLLQEGENPKPKVERVGTMASLDLCDVLSLSPSPTTASTETSSTQDIFGIVVDV